MVVRVAVLLFVVCAAACARSVPVVAPDVREGEFDAAVALADERAAAGCYVPLGEALDAYDAALHIRDVHDVRERAFRTAVWLALRERALGLVPGRFQDAPARLASGLPDSLTTVPLELLDITPWRRGTKPGPTSTLPFDVIRRRAHAVHQALAPLVEDDAWYAAQYVTLRTHHPFAPLPPDEPLSGRVEPLTEESAPWVSTHAESPAFDVTWRLTQRGQTTDEWEAWHAARPECVEALVAQSDLHLSQRRLASADRVLGEALAQLPDLVPARAMRGEVRLQLADYVVALDEFLEVLGRVPTHPEASLGEVEALSNLSRHADAILAADAMLVRGAGYPGDAHYWRAWNLFQLGRVAEARAALDQARRTLANANLHYLGGAIAYREERWEDARDDLRQAIAMDVTHCDAQFTLASVALLERTWPDAASAFADAAACFRLRVPALEVAIAEVDAADVPDTMRIRLRVHRMDALEANVRQERWALYNRAVSLANAGAPDQARELAESVAALGGDPATAARDLLIQLDRQR